MSDLADGLSTLIVNEADPSRSPSLPFPMSFRVNTLHHVTAGVNTSVDLMALQVRFPGVCKHA